MCNQVIVAGMGEVIGLNHLAIIKVMELYDIADRRRCFEKVLYLWNKLRERAEEEKAKDAFRGIR